MIDDMPNKQIKQEVQAIMKYGFEYGIPEPYLSKLSNKKCVYYTQQPEEIDKHLIKWMKDGQIFVDDSIEPYCYVPLFLKDEITKTRLIPDFKHEVNGVSLNSLVLDHFKTVQYPKTTQLLDFVYGDGEINYLGKNDGLSFFRQINMAPSNMKYAGYYHRGITFLDGRMPWGTPRAPRVAHFLSIALVYIANKYIPRTIQPCILPYVDDRILRAKTETRMKLIHMIFIIVCYKAGTPCKQSKTVFCDTTLVGLGIGFDLRGMKTVFVPQHKKERYIECFQQFISKKQATAKEAQSVVGKCEHICPIKWPFRVYNRILYNAIPHYQSENQVLQVTDEIKYAVIQWIHALQKTAPARLDLLINPPKIFDYTIYTDGSDIGYGGFEGSTYFYDQYFENEVNPSERNIKDRELYPIAIMLKTNVHKYANCNILLKCDNQNAVLALINKDIRNPRTHNLVILICELAIEYSFWFYADYLQGETNSLADALSRLQINRFKRLAHEQGLVLDPAPMLFQRIPFDFGSGVINTKFAPITYRD